jgi:hypothetical protein
MAVMGTWRPSLFLTQRRHYLRHLSFLACLWISVWTLQRQVLVVEDYCFATLQAMVPCLLCVMLAEPWL